MATIQLGAKERNLPNIVIFLTDDQGYAEMGCQGNTDIPTPNIDRIAASGVRFTNGYVTCSVCAPSRAGLLTGRYQNRFGFERNYTAHLNEDPQYGLPMREETLAEYLLHAGYVSGVIGKWHLGATAQYHPYRQGFDEFFGFLHEGHFYVAPPYKGVTTWLRRKVLPWGGEDRWTSADGKTIYSTEMNDNESDYDANNPIIRGSQPVDEPEYLTDAFGREAVDFIDRNKDKPFLLYLAFNAVHSPLQAADAYMEKFSHIQDIQRRIFAAMLSNMDDAIGRVIKKLRNENLEDDTIIILLSDNGGPTKELTSSNAPLRDGKGSLYEGGIRVPFIVQWKNGLPQGQVYDQPVISLDLFPTLAAAAGKPVESKNMDGVNLIPYLTGQAEGSPHEFLYWSFQGKQALRKDIWKMVRPGKDMPLELYNLEEDIGESNDLANKNPQILQELKELYDAFSDKLTHDQ